MQWMRKINGRVLPATLVSILILGLLGLWIQFQVKADTNAAPTVSASSSAATVGLLQTIDVTATVTDDGFPSGELTYAWSKVSGPGDVGFADATRKDTTAAFSKAGSYVIRLTVDDGELATTSDVSITVNSTIAYTITDLGTLGGSTVSVSAINNRGHIVGQSTLTGDTQTHAFFWHSGTMDDLGTLGGNDSAALGINNGSYVVGESTDLEGEKHAFVWDGTTMSDLGTYPETTGTETTANGIDDLGRITGTADASTTPKAVTFDGFNWSDLGTLGGSWAVAAANNIRNQITGQSQDGNAIAQAFIYTQPNGMLTLNPLDGTTGGNALAINAYGDVVGQASTASSEQHAFLYQNDEGKDLGTLGGTSSVANDINNLGDVVGSSQDASSDDCAFVYFHGVMIDLNDVIDPAAGWTLLTEAKSINDAGLIVGHGTISGNTRAFLLTPVTAQFNTMITLPDDQTDYNEGDSVTIHAVAAISSGSINKVSFYEGSNLLGEDTTAPYSLTWATPAIGSYDITCMATASDTSTVTSDVVHINVLNVNDPPSVVLDAPPSGIRYASGADIQISATVTDPDGDETIAKVEYYQGVTKLGETTQLPHTYTWLTVIPGDYSLTAKATDNEGLTGTSSPVAVTVNTIPLPGMALWLRSDAGIVLDGNNKIQTWQDQSGNARHLTQANEDARPTLVAAQLNGMPAVRFDGIDDALAHSLSTAYVGNSTIYLILKSNEATPAQNTTFFATAASSGISGSFELTTDDQAPANLAISQNNTGYQAITPTPDAYQLITIQIEDTLAKVYADGAMQAEYTITSGDYSAIASYVLGRNRAGDKFANCDVVELLVYESAQTQTQIVETQNALSGEYAINQQPTITWDAPASDSNLTVGQSVTLSVTASDADDAIQQVEFFANDISLGLGTDPEADGTYNFQWTPSSESPNNNLIGMVNLHAVVTDDDSIAPKSARTSSVAVNVVYPVLPGETLVEVPGVEVVSGLGAGRAIHVRDGYLFVACNGPTGGAGKVLVYQRDVSGWVYDTTLSGLSIDDGFGSCLLFDDSQLFVGVSGADGNLASAVVFTVDELGVWDGGVAMELPAEVVAAGISGSTVVLGENVIAVGCPSANDRSGVVYIFQKIDGTWTPVQTLTDGEAITNDRRFGTSLAVSGNRMLIGATNGHDDDDTLDPIIKMAGAVYVFERADVNGDWGYVDKIQLDDPQSLATFGSSVALNGDTAVIGAPRTPGTGQALYRMGKAYVYNFDGSESNWNLSHTLIPSDGANGDTFGKAVAMDGDYALIGSPARDADESTTNVGGVYMYHLPTLSMPSVALIAPDAGEFVFGDLVDGDMTLTADATANGSSTITKVEFFVDGTSIGDGIYNAGSYEYLWEDVTWDRHELQVRTVSDEGIAALSAPVTMYATQDPAFDEQRLIATDGTSWDLFGYAVDVTSDQTTGNEYAIVGAHGDQANGEHAGSAYIFEKDTVTGNWVQAIKLTSTDSDKYWEGFGFAVAIHGDMAFVGVTQDTTEDNVNGAGTVYVYQRSESSNQWEALGSPLVAWDGNTEGSFGQAIAVNDTTLVIGAPEDDESTEITDAGAVYVYTWSGSAWVQGSKLSAPIRTKDDGYGLSVAMDATHLIVGCPGDDDDTNSITDSGKVYFYALSDLSSVTVLSPEDYAVSESQTDAHFGESVAIDNGLAVIGAASASGDFSYQGKAYVAKLSNTNDWSALQVFTASDAAQDDSFGVSVAIHDDLVAVGSFFDDDNASNTGSVYLFQQSGINLTDGSSSDVFTEIAKFGAHDASPNAAFGISVAISDSTIAVGNLLNGEQGENAGAAYLFRRPKAPVITISSPLADSQVDNDTDVSVTVQVTASDATGITLPQLWADTTQLASPIDNGDGTYTFNWHTPVTDQVVQLNAAVSNIEGMASGMSQAVRANTNDTPIPSATPEPYVLTLGSGDSQIGLTDLFNDPDGDGLSYEVTGNTLSGVIGTAIDGDILTISLLQNTPATGTLTLTATDPYGQSATTTITIDLTYPVLPGETLVGVAAGEVVSGLGAGSLLHVRDGYLFVASNGPTDSVGKVLVYQRDASGWVYDTTLSGIEVGDGFGSCLLFDDSQLFVGVTGSGASGGDGNIASAVVFTVDELGVWDSGVAMALPPEVTAVGISGSTVVLGENVIAVGCPTAPGIADGVERRGVLYIFQKVDGAWTPVQTLTDGEATDRARRFGSSIAVSGNRLLVGATNGHDDDDTIDPIIKLAGAVYVFERADASALWSQTDKLQLADPTGLETFGSSVALNGDTAVIGSPGSSEPLYRMGKAYVYTYDSGSWSLTHTLLASDGFGGDTFGKSVAIDGDYALIGSPARDADESTTNVGGVYMYHLPTLNVPSVVLSAPVAGPFDFDALVNGDMTLTADATAAGDSSISSGGKVEFYANGQLLGEGIYNAGSYEYLWEDVTWDRHRLQVRTVSDEGIAALSTPVTVYATQTPAFDEQRLIANDGTSWDLFGYAVDVTIDQATGNEYAIVGAHGDQAAGEHAGSAYIFEKDDATGNWVQVQKLINEDSDKYWEGFGFAVAIHEDMAFVGVTQDSTEDNTKGPGTVYVYQRNSDTGVWGALKDTSDEPVVLTAWDGNTEGSFGQAIAFNGSILAIGAPADDESTEITDAGAVYLYSWDGNTFASLSGHEKVVAPVRTKDDGYGLSLAMDDTHLIVGCPGDDDDTNSITDSGKVYFYALSDLSSVTVLSPTDFAVSESQTDAHFGESVAIDNGLAVIGAASASGDFSYQGKAYVAKLSNTNDWSALQVLTASDAAEEDSLGVSVAIHDDLIAVGSFYDDDNASNTGSVYLFQQSGINLTDGSSSDVFTEIAKFGAHDASPEAAFGISVAISDNTIAAGNLLNGQNGQNAGAAYLFRRPKAPVITITSPLAGAQVDNDTDIPVTVQVTTQDTVTINTPVLWAGATQLTNLTDNGDGTYTFNWDTSLITTTQDMTLRATITNSEWMASKSEDVTVTVNANHAPTLAAISMIDGPDEDPATPFEISYAVFAAYASDVDAEDALSFRVNSIENGTVAVNGVEVTTVTDDAINATQLVAGQSFQWQPATNTNGELSAFTISVYDGKDSSELRQVTIDVAPVNDQPYVDLPVVDRDLVQNADPVDIDLTGVFKDVEDIDSTLSLSATSDNALITPTISGSILTLTVTTDQLGTATITVTAEDSGQLTVQESFDVTVSVYVAPTIETIPTIIGTYQDEEMAIEVDDLWAHVSGSGGGAIQLFVQTLDSGTLRMYDSGGSFTVVTRDVDSANATLLEAGKTLLWTPATGVTGDSVAAFQIIAFDGEEYSSPAQVTVQVLSSAAPRLSEIGVIYGASEGENGFVVPLANYLNVYVPDDGTVTYTIQELHNGTLYKNGSIITAATSWTDADVLTWDPPVGVGGKVEAFTIMAESSGIQSRMQTVSIHIATVNDSPELDPITTVFNTAKNAPVTITYDQLAAFATDPDNDATTLQFKVTGVFTGSLQTSKQTTLESAGINSSILGDEAFVWTPPTDRVDDVDGFSAFEIVAYDGEYQSAKQTITIKVTNQDQTPQVKWVALVDQDLFDQGMDIQLQAIATDAEDAASELFVEFLADGQLLGTATYDFASERFVYTWECVESVDAVELTIRATDTQGNSTVSDARIVHIYDIPTQSLGLWLKADSGVTADENQKVSLWLDHSYATPGLSQETIDAQPTLVASAVNDLPAIYFDGVNDVLSHTLTESYNGPSTVFMVIRSGTASTTDQADIFNTSFSDGYGMNRMVVDISQSTAQLQIKSDSTSMVSVDLGPIPDQAFHLVEWQIAGDTIRVYRDGVLLTEASLEETDLKQISSYVFGKLQTAGQSFDIAECLVYQTDLDSELRQVVESKLVTKYAIEPDNSPEVVQIVSPSGSYSFDTSSTVLLEASVTTTDVISSVEFFANGVSLGSVSTKNASDNYELSWQPPADGLYLIKIKVTDVHGTITEDQVMQISIGLEDSDGDGMPDSWEDEYGLDKLDPNDAGMDADSDGVNNLDEFITGQNPNSGVVVGYEEAVRLIVYMNNR